MKLKKIEEAAASCARCELYKTRKNPVFARGAEHSPLMIVGMVPGPEENEQGKPFVGRAGKMLDKIVECIGIENPYITNLVKCWLKPGLPLKDEWIDPCLQYIVAQIFTIKPKVIITLGLDASRTLLALEPEIKMGSIRGNAFFYSTCERTPPIYVIPTYHPSYLLRGGGEKHDQYPKVLEDFLLAESIVHSGG